ncbi:hypothetical protein MSG28_013934 [Choristoneura fumiferana]|uniref:Uncharacterized protein n=1 Tax=Choristoneura fumiferana TaxID=7141 RepID=A0ACC0K991_CHOFU|nr:hypothetical protein MSG28_013934 [Choristoneura fumiferana]
MSSKLFVVCVALLVFQLQKFARADIDGADINPDDLVFFLNVVISPHTSSDPNNAAASVFPNIKCPSGKEGIIIGNKLHCKNSTGPSRRNEIVSSKKSN